MKTVTMFTMMFLSTILCFGQVREYYISPSGNDFTGDGTMSNPYLTLNKVRTVVRADIKTDGMEDDIYVYLRGGTYSLLSTVNFSTADGGINGYKIYYKSYPGEEAIISGGINIPSNIWEYVGSGKYRASLSTLGTFNIRQLYINGQRGIRSRLENNSTYNIRATTTSTVYQFNTLPTLSRPNEIEVVSKWAGWQWTIKKVSSIGSNAINLVNPLSNTFFYIYPSTATSTTAIVPYLENALEFVDSPGEWYYDKTANYIYIIPFNGSSPGTVIIPVLDKLISGTNVSNLVFDGLTFSYGAWSYMVNNDFDPLQASAHYESGVSQFIPGNIEFVGSSYLSFTNNKFTHLGATGLCLKTSSTNCSIQNNQFFDVSSDAIRIGDPNNSTDYTNTITVSNNIIHDCGVEYKGSVGVFLGFVRNVNVSSNSIFNLPYTGISMGWAWDTHATYIDNNTLQGNEIYNVMMELNDGAAIYNLGQHVNRSFIQNNYIHNILQNGKIHAGIYLDQGSNNLTVQNNSGDLFPLDDAGRNTDLFFNFNQNSEAQGNIFGTNNFGANSFWIKKIVRDNNQEPNFRAPALLSPWHIYTECCGDMGVNFVDVDHDGRKDIVYFRTLSNNSIQQGTYLNKVDHWEYSSNPQYLLPYNTAKDGLKDTGARFVDLNNDGFDDLIYYRWIDAYTAIAGAYINSSTGWVYSPNFIPPYHFSADYRGDLGARLVDVNWDGRKDIVFYRDLGNGTFQQGVYLNNGNGWTFSNNSAYVPPVIMYKDVLPYGDTGVRFVDLNGDGRDDLVQSEWVNSSTVVRSAYIKTSWGWTYNSNYLPPYHLSADFAGDLGARFVDVDWNGKRDIVFNRDLGNGTYQAGVYLNNGTTWVSSSDAKYVPPVILYKDGVGDQGVRFVDLNGDNHEDIIKGYYDNTGQLISDFYLNKVRMFYYTQTPPLPKQNNQNSTVNDNSMIPSEFALNQNYPNPFNPSTVISFSVPVESKISIKIYNTLGQEIETLLEDYYSPGNYQITWHPSNVTSGIYYYQLSSNNFVKTKKAIYLK